MATAARPRGRPFTQGNTANPGGRPRGSRNRGTLALEKMMEGDAAEIVATVLQAARNGDLQACKLILDRLCPPPRDNRLTLDLPAIDGAVSVAVAQAAVIEAVVSGQIRPSEGHAVAALLELSRLAVETQDFEARLTAIETRKSP